MGRWTAFWRGFGSVFDIFPARRHVPLSEAEGFEADTRAIAGDWRKVGDDLRTAVKKAATEKPN